MIYLLLFEYYTIGIERVNLLHLYLTYVFERRKDNILYTPLYLYYIMYKFTSSDSLHILMIIFAIQIINIHIRSPLHFPPLNGFQILQWCLEIILQLYV